MLTEDPARGEGQRILALHTIPGMSAAERRRNTQNNDQLPEHGWQGCGSLHVYSDWIFISDHAASNPDNQEGFTLHVSQPDCGRREFIYFTTSEDLPSDSPFTSCTVVYLV